MSKNSSPQSKVQQETTIKIHHDYPFVRYGLAFDFHPHLYNMDPSDHVIEQTDWWLEINGQIYGFSYDSRESVLADIENVLFSDFFEEVVQQQIKSSVLAGNIELALLLSENKGKGIGYRNAYAKFNAIDLEIEKLLHKRSNSR